MKSLKVKVAGETPLLTHSNQMAVPLNIYKKAIAPLTSKNKKSDADHELISRIEWEAGLYLDQDGRISILGEGLERMLWDAAKKNRNGVKIKTAVRVDDIFIPINFGLNGFCVKNKPQKSDEIPNPELDKIFEKYFDRRTAKVKGSGGTVIRTRPRFDKWSLEFKILYDETILDELTILETLKVAESQIGIGDFRPRYGRFTCEVERLE